MVLYKLQLIGFGPWLVNFTSLVGYLTSYNTADFEEGAHYQIMVIKISYYKNHI